MIVRTVALLVVFACVVTARADETSPLVVSLRPYASVGARTIRIADVADLTGGTPALREAVAALDLADAANVRTKTTVTRQQVAFRVQIAEVPSALFRVEGAAETHVEPERCVVSEADVIATAKEALLHRLPWNADDISVRLLQPIAVSLGVVASRADVRIKAETHATTMPLGHVQMDVTLFAAGERLLAFPLYLEVQLIQKVAVCLHKIERGDVLNETNVSFDRRPVDGLRDYLSSPEALSGRRARQALLPGHVLTTTDVEDNPRETGGSPLVRKGEMVKLIVRLGPVNVTVSGEALQDGRAGQPVRVRNIDSKQVVLGRVTERSLVEVDP